jgi:hypothetical protein
MQKTQASRLRPSITNSLNFTNIPNGQYNYFVDIIDKAENYNLTPIRNILVDNTITINWECNIEDKDKDSNNYVTDSNSSNFYINRGNKELYRLIIQRPQITKDALTKYAETVAYLFRLGDCVATASIIIDGQYKEAKKRPFH